MLEFSFGKVTFVISNKIRTDLQQSTSLDNQKKLLLIPVMVRVSANGGAAIWREVCVLSKQRRHFQLHPQRVVLPNPEQF
jgi:hypothetical protein